MSPVTNSLQRRCSRQSETDHSWSIDPGETWGSYVSCKYPCLTNAAIAPYSGEFLKQSNAQLSVHVWTTRRCVSLSPFGQVPIFVQLVRLKPRPHCPHCLHVEGIHVEGIFLHVERSFYMYMFLSTFRRSPLTCRVFLLHVERFCRQKVGPGDMWKEVEHVQLLLSHVERSLYMSPQCGHVRLHVERSLIFVNNLIKYNC